MSLRALFVACIAGIFFGGSVHAIVEDNSASTNQTAPSSGAPWYNVGAVTSGSASGVYLSNGWVITAYHVLGNSTSGTATIDFNGVSYVSSRLVLLTNPDGSDSDVAMFYIGATPANTVSLSVATALPAANTTYTMIGYGQHASGSKTSYSVTSGTVYGYDWDGVQGTQEAWGTNQRSTTEGYVTVPGNNSFYGFGMAFDVTNSSDSNEAMAAPGDSGGGVFYKQGPNWLLLGTMNAIGFVSGQAGNTSVNGDATYVADLTQYLTQIDAILLTVPEPPGWALFIGGLGGVFILKKLFRRVKC